jgi:hypothetical protein
MQVSPLCDVPRAGQSYISYQFNVFLGTAFSYSRYPVDRQELYLAFEDYLHDNTKLKYVVDSESDFQSETIAIPGFFLDDKVSRELKSHEPTTLGLGGMELTYSRAEIGLVWK